MFRWIQAALAPTLAMAAIAGTARAESLCPISAGPITVCAIGSSSVGSVLGPMLQRVLRGQGVALRYWGQASSGLARPDHHDWLAIMPRLMADLRPDVVIVALGVNDSQNLWEGGNWIAREDPQWEVLYARRVDALLERAAGAERERLVVWLGPYAYVDWRAEEQLPIVTRIQQERVEAFRAGGGRAVFIDVYAATLGPDGRPVREVTIGEAEQVAGKRSAPFASETLVLRTEDGIHLTTGAIRWLMADPILAALAPCLPGAGGDAKEPEADGGQAAPAP